MDNCLRYNNIIFDFDGVLVESLDIKEKAFYSLYKSYGEKIATQVVKHHKSNGGMSRFDKFKFYHNCFLKKKINQSELDALCTKFSSLVVKKVINCNEVKGASSFLKKTFNRKKWIVSATPQDEIVNIVNGRGWKNHFLGIYGSPKNKIDIVEKIINDCNLKKQETVFLGDAKSDYKAAKFNGLDFILRQTIENFNIFKNKKTVKKFDNYIDLEI